MNILIDTNIIISREDYKEVPTSLSSLLRLFQENSVKVLIHPLSRKDINRDLDKKRRAISLSKIASYPELKSPPVGKQDQDFLKIVGQPKNPRDSVDIELLYSVYKDAVNFLVTNDQGILTKAQRLELIDRVFSVEESLEFFNKQFIKFYSAPTPAVKSVPVHNLDLSDPIFEGLKREYPEFQNWWRKISQEGRMAWVFQGPDGKLGGILILNEENEPIDSVPPIPKARRLKICTFKVSSQGQKLGELFLKLAIRHALKNNLEEMYLTHFTKPVDELANLIEPYGFIRKAKKTNGEDIFLKRVIQVLRKEDVEKSSPVTLNRELYPGFYDGARVKKHIIPIRPEYHDRLFIEYRGRTPTLFEQAGYLIIEGNTIKKAYICHTRSRKLGPGDVLLFYRSVDKELTSLCTVEEVFQEVKDYEDALRIVGKRTVYSKDDLLDILKHGPATIILFLLHFELSRYINLRELQQSGILKKAPQSVTEISHEKYRRILKRGNLDERLTLH